MNDAARTGKYVSGQISALAHAKNESATRTALAVLRRGIGKPPGSNPQLWALTLSGLPEPLLGNGETPTDAEWAAHIALTLFALHQQSKSIQAQCMHQPGERLGIAVRRLVRSEEDQSRVKRRFDAAATSESVEELANHLRGLVQLLRAEGISLDYAALAEDLVRFQTQAGRDAVRLGWGRDFYRIRTEDTQKGGENHE